MFQFIPLMFMELFQLSLCIFFSFIMICYVSVDPANVYRAVSVFSVYIFLVYCDLLCFSWSCWCSWSCFSLISVYFSRLLWSVMFQLIPLMFMELFQFDLCIFFSFIVICYVSVDPADVHGAVSVCSGCVWIVHGQYLYSSFKVYIPSLIHCVTLWAHLGKLTYVVCQLSHLSLYYSILYPYLCLCPRARQIWEL